MSQELEIAKLAVKGQIEVLSLDLKKLEKALSAMGTDGSSAIPMADDVEVAQETPVFKKKRGRPAKAR